MTKEKAIEYLKRADVTVGREIKTKTAEALEMAIKALEQESIDDAISRIIKRMWNCKGNHTTSIDKVMMERILRDELNPHTCEDAISRQAVLEIFGYVMSYWKEHAIDVEPHEIEDAIIEQYEFTAKELSELPSVTPKPKTDVLDKIREEIEHLDYLNIEDGSDGYDKYIDQYDVMKLFDKYKAKSEEGVEE